MGVKDELHSLLGQIDTSSLARECLQDFVRLVLSRSSQRMIPVQELRSIFGVRAIINEKKGVGIQGFDELVPSLKTYEGKIFLHSLEDENSKRYLIFTDETITALIGILKFPQKTQLASIASDDRYQSYSGE